MGKLEEGEKRVPRVFKSFFFETKIPEAASPRNFW
jgi:hypothetical protein